MSAQTCVFLSSLLPYVHGDDLATPSKTKEQHMSEAELDQFGRTSRCAGQGLVTFLSHPSIKSLEIPVYLWSPFVLKSFDLWKIPDPVMSAIDQLAVQYPDITMRAKSTYNTNGHSLTISVIFERKETNLKDVRPFKQ